MAAPNYSFEKRKRELAKKAAKEAKRLRKADKSDSSTTDAVVEEEAAADSPRAVPDTSTDA